MDKPPRAARTVVGHPVDVASGVVFTAWHDVELAGYTNLIWRRFFSTANTDLVTPLGRGWTTPFFMELSERADGLVLRDDEGSELVFPRIEDRAVYIDAAAEMEVYREGDRYRIYYWHHRESWIFEQADRSGSWRLAWIADLPGNRTLVQYDVDGRFLAVRHPDGRLVRATYGPHGFIGSLSLEVGDWPPMLLVQYEYDGASNLTAAYDAAGNPLRYAYDHRNLITAETNRLGGTFRFEYDRDGWCTYAGGEGNYMSRALEYDRVQMATRVTDSIGHVSTYVLDDRGLVIREIDPLGVAIDKAYDDLGHLGAVATPTGTIEFGRDEFGRVTTLTDRLGRTTVFEYDARHLPTLMRHADGTERRWDYNESGALVRITDESGSVWTYERDGQGRLVTAITPNGHRTDVEYGPAGLWHVLRDADGWIRYEYDAKGDLVRVVDGLGIIEQRAYDAVGNPVAITQADGAVYRFTPDADGNVLAEQDELGRSTHHVYSVFGDLLQVVHADGTAVRFSYDTEARLVAIENEKGERSLAAYDATGNVVEQQFFDGRTEHYVHDGMDNLIEIGRPDGLSIMQKFDAVGNLIEQSSDDGLIARFEYDAHDRIIRAESAAATIEFVYDAAGRILRETQNDQILDYAYDAEGNRIEQTQPGPVPRMLRFEHDLRRRVIRILDDATPVMDFTYDSSDQIVARRAAGGVEERLAYDVRGRLTHQQVRAGTEVVTRRRYTYDAADDLIEIDDSTRGRTAYSYDDRERLTRVERRGMASESFAWDACGNLQSHGSSIGPGNRLLSMAGREFEYNANGEPVAEITSDGSTRFAYDSAGRIARVVNRDGTETTYVYDAFGRRLTKTHDGRTTRFIWAGHQLIGEIQADGSLVEYITIQFQPLAMLVDGEWHTVITDHLSKPHEVIDSAGSVAWRGEFSPFGQLVQQSGAHANPLRLPGQYADSETGLHYNRFRYYDAVAGRFTTPDPIGLAGGLNEYVYAPNLIVWEDPLGLNCGQAHFKIKANTKKGSLKEWKAKRDAFNKARRNKNAKIPSDADYKKRIRPEADKEAAAARKKAKMGSDVDADHPGDVRATGLLGQQLEPRSSGVNRSFGSQVGNQSRKRPAGSRTPMADLVDDNGRIIK